MGRSRGGMTTKIRYAVDGNGRPLAVVVTGGQRHDGVILPQVLADIRVHEPVMVLNAGVRTPSWPIVLKGPEPIVSTGVHTAFGH